MLVVTIYFTLLDLAWIAFLLGVLFAAVLSILSQTIKAQWVIMRRTAQLRRAKELLTEQSARSERAAQSVKLAEMRFRAVIEALPVMVLFVDRDERCRHHNRAFQEWCGRSDADIDGVPLSDLIDDANYRELGSHGMEALLGKERQYESRWSRSDLETQVAVKLLPYPPNAQTTSGFYVFVTTITPTRAKPLDVVPVAGEDSAPTLCVETTGEQLSVDEDAREHLLRAIEEDQFTLLEQTIEPLSCETKPAQVSEILLRLGEREDHMLPPRAFFEVAEHYGLMPAIDRWVVRKLLKASAAMKAVDRTWRMPLYCVNLSSATLADRTFTNHIRTQLEHWGLSGDRLCFEIHQRVLAGQETDVRTLIEQLKPLGCRFTVDCFGSQKISFVPFTHLHFDFLKIDGSIIGEVLRNKAELAKAGAIVLACRKIGIRTIAQFVEDELTRGKLSEIGVDYVQGFGVHKPVPLSPMASVATA